MQATDPNIILEIQNLSCGYGGKPVLEDFNLLVAKGESIAITGPNGSGKSTLLKTIYQLCLINRGNIFYRGILINNKTPEQVKKMGIAYFMQKNAVFSKLTVKENLVLSLNGINKKERNLKIEEIITLFPDISGWLKKTAGLLSGGQRQQLAMAMLVAQYAHLWLLDEPTAGLDSEKSEIFIKILKDNLRKNTENSKTLIFVEHKINIINQLAKKICVIKS